MLIFYAPRPRYVPDRQYVQHNDLPDPVGFTDQRLQHVVGELNVLFCIPEKTPGGGVDRCRH